MQKSFIKFNFLTKSFFLITVLALLGCASGGSDAPPPPPLPDPPDLVVSVTASQTIIASGADITLKATVTNKGIAASDSSELLFYSSDDRTISDKDTKIGNLKIVSILDPDETEDSFVMTTGHSTGTKYYGACVKAVSNETNTANNCSDGFSVTVGAPDLVVSSFTANPATIDSGGTVSLSAIVTNSGNGTADSITLRYHRSTNNSIIDSGIPIATDDISNLLANSSSDATVDVTGHSSGIYYYWACVVSSETARTNNCSDAKAITGPQPDLAVVDFTANSSTTTTDINSGGVVNLSAKVRNIGNFIANSIELKYYRSQNNSTNDSANNLVTTDSISNLSADSSSDATAEVTGHSSGIYYYWACVVAVAGETNC